MFLTLLHMCPAAAAGAGAASFAAESEGKHIIRHPHTWQFTIRLVTFDFIIIAKGVYSRECIVVIGKGEPPEARVDSLDLMGCASPRLRGNWFRRRNCCHCLKLPPEVTRSIFTTQFNKMHSASVGTYSIYFKVSSLIHSVSSCPRLILLKSTLNYVLSI